MTETRFLRHPHSPRPRASAARRIGAAPTLGLEAVLIAGCCLLTWWISSVLVSPHWSWIALLEFLWLCILCFRIEPRGFALLLPIIVIPRASVVVALIAVEYGARLPELGIVGQAGPYTSSYVFFTAVLFASSLASFRYVTAHTRRSRASALTSVFDRLAQPISLAVIAIGLLATLWLAALGASRGFPLLINMDRFVFRRVFADPLTLNILNCKAILAGALGLVSFALPVSRAIKAGSHFTLALFIGINFLFGDKFFIIISTACSYFAPYLYLNHQQALRKLPQLTIITLLLLLPVGSFTWFIYSNQGRATVEATSQKLTERFAAQGELWYLQVKIGAPTVDWHSDFVAKNVASTTIKQVDIFALRNGIGSAYFMNRYAPDKIRAAQMRNAGAVTYTMALEPLALAMFGWCGLFMILCICGVIFAAGAAYIAYAIERRLMLSMLFAGYVTLTLKSFSTQGGPWVVFSIYTLKWFSVILIIEMVLSLLEASQATTALNGQQWRRRRQLGGQPYDPEAKT